MMLEIAKKAEEKTLFYSAIACIATALVAALAAYFSGSQAILLDGLFNLTYFLASLFTLRVSRLVMKGDDEHYPAGYSFFEPLVNGMKGLLILGVSIMAMLGAIEALFAGGRHIDPGMAVVYAAIATGVGVIMTLVSRSGFKKSQSPLVKADADGWIVNAAVSSSVLMAFGSIFLIQDSEYAYLSPYIDPALVLVVVLISISVPIRMAWQAIQGLLNRAPSAEIVSSVRTRIEDSLGDFPVQELFVRVLQPGRIQAISIHVVLDKNYELESLKTLDEQRRKTLESLKQQHPMIVMDMLFTHEREWGAPCSHM
jgi:cation diffusion facilitator family transporter